MGRLDDDKRVWHALERREKARRRNLEELKRIMMGTGGRTPKSLLKLVVYSGGIKVAEAADIVGVRRPVINKWLKILLSKKLVDVESTHHPNPTIKPTKQVMNEVSGYYSKEKPKPLKPTRKGTIEAEKALEDMVAEVDRSRADGEPAIGAEEEETLKEGITLEAGGTYLFLENKPCQSIRAFTKEVREGTKGLFISRSNPDRVKKKYYLGGARVVWLSSVHAPAGVEAVTGIQNLSILVGKFLDKNEKSIILLDGVEYMIANNSFQVVLRLIQQLRDKTSTTESKLIIPLNPNALKERQLPLLEVECKTVK